MTSLTALKQFTRSWGHSGHAIPVAASSPGPIRSQLSHGCDMWWSPTIPAAVVAGMPWLDVHCPGCRTSRAIDTKPSDRLPLASVVGAHAVAPHLYPFALRIPGVDP